MTSCDGLSRWRLALSLIASERDRRDSIQGRAPGPPRANWGGARGTPYLHHAGSNAGARPGNLWQSRSLRTGPVVTREQPSPNAVGGALRSARRRERRNEGSRADQPGPGVTGGGQNPRRLRAREGEPLALPRGEVILRKTACAWWRDRSSHTAARGCSRRSEEPNALVNARQRGGEGAQGAGHGAERFMTGLEARTPERHAFGSARDLLAGE